MLANPPKRWRGGLPIDIPQPGPMARRREKRKPAAAAAAGEAGGGGTTAAKAPPAGFPPPGSSCGNSSEPMAALEECLAQAESVWLRGSMA